MAKINLQDVGSVSANENSFIVLTNNNNAEIETKSDTFLSRDGSSPNQMDADLDMNSHKILNLPAPVDLTDPVRLQDILDIEDIILEPELTSPEATVKGRAVGAGIGDTQDLTATQLNALVGTEDLVREETGGGAAEIRVNSQGSAVVRVTRASSGSTPADCVLQRARGTLTVPTAPPANVNIGRIRFDAYDGVDSYRTTSSIVGQMMDTASPTDMEARLIFSACPDGSITNTELCRMSHDEGILSGVDITRAEVGAVPALITITSEDTANVRIQRSSTGSAAPAITLKRSRGTVATPTAVAQDVNLGEIVFQGYGATGFANGATIRSTVTAATPSDTDMESRLTFDACAASAATPTEMMRLEHDTGLSMFGTNPVIDQNRHFQLRSYTVATLPSASPAGMLAFCSDETGGAVPIFSDDTNWRRMTDRNVVS